MGEHAKEAAPGPDPDKIQWEEAPTVAPAEVRLGLVSNIDQLWSQSSAGALPVTDRICEGDDLIVIGHSNEVTASTVKPIGVFMGLGVEVRDFSTNSSNFRAVLRPTGSTKIHGDLMVKAAGAPVHFPLDIKVIPKSGTLDATSRPLSTAGAKQNLAISTSKIFENRILGLTAFVQEANNTKPVNKTLLDRFLGAAVEVALSTVTSSLGNAASIAVEKRHGSKLAVDLTKSITSKSLERLAQFTASSLTESAAGGSPQFAGVTNRMSPAGAFLIVQGNALTDMKEEATKAIANTSFETVNGVDKATSGEGYLALLAADEAADVTAKSASDLQYSASTQGYAVLLAKTALGTVDGERAHVSNGDSAGATDLAGHVDTSTASLSDHFAGPRGVLRLDLESDDGEHYKVSSSRFKGFANDDMVTNLSSLSIGELKIPIRAFGSDGSQLNPAHFVIARNEQDQYFAQFSENFLRPMVNPVTPEVQARKIFASIASQHVSPKRES